MIKNNLVVLLETLNYPVFLQGSLNPDEQYPDSFFTFWNFDTPETAFYDDAANRAVWGFWIYFYSVDPVLVEQMSEQARQLLKQNGYTLQGKPNDISVDRPTHSGVMFTTYKFENYESEVETNEQSKDS